MTKEGRGDVALDFSAGLTDSGVKFRFLKGAGNTIESLGFTWQKTDAAISVDNTEMSNTIYMASFIHGDGGFALSDPKVLAVESGNILAPDYDAYINNGNVTAAILITDPDGRNGAILSETGHLGNEIAVGVRYSAGLAVPGASIPITFDVSNKGFSAVTGLVITIGSASAQTLTGTAIQPLGSKAFTLDYTLPATAGSTSITVKATFADGSVYTYTTEVSIGRADISVKVLTIESDSSGRNNAILAVKNESPFALGSGAAISLGLYADPLGRIATDGTVAYTLSNADITQLNAGGAVTRSFTLAPDEDAFAVASMQNDSNPADNMCLIRGLADSTDTNEDSGGDDSGGDDSSGDDSSGGDSGGETTPTNPADVDPETDDDIIPVNNPFIDVKSSDWFYDSVMFAYTHGLMIGTNTAPMMFSPNMTTTRGMIVTILYRMAGSPDVGDAALGVPLYVTFTDVAADMYYTDAVRWAAANGIVKGYGGGLYGPEDNVTREQLTVILNNYLKYAALNLPTVTEYTGFNDDADIADYAAEAIKKFFEAGIIVGKGNGIFDPKGDATRAEVATMLMRLIEAVEME